MAVLAYVDFFPLHVQRTALVTASNMCRRGVPSDSMHFLQDAVPLLENIIAAGADSKCYCVFSPFVLSSIHAYIRVCNMRLCLGRNRQ